MKRREKILLTGYSRGPEGPPAPPDGIPGLPRVTGSERSLCSLAGSSPALQRLESEEKASGSKSEPELQGTGW